MSSISRSMKGIVIERHGGVEVLKFRNDLPVPEPTEGMVLVKNEFVGINYIDTYFRSGLYPVPMWPYILGRESAGVVVSAGTGDLYGLEVGDRVVALSNATYAEYTAAPAAKAVRIPDGLSSMLAAGSLLQGLTALTLTHEAYSVQKDDWVLIHAAAGGTGLWLCQILKLLGARTIATASTNAKLDLAREAGAQYLINSTQNDVKRKVLNLTEGNGVAAVFDGVGKSTFDLSMECLARKGSLISFGNANGAVPPLTITRLSAKNVKLMRPTLNCFIEERREFEYYTQRLFYLILQGGLNTSIHNLYPLAEVAKAHRDLEERRTTGKLLLDLST